VGGALALHSLQLFARYQAYVRNIPARTGQGFHDRDDHDNEKRDMNQGPNDPQRYGNDPSHDRDRRQNRQDDAPDDIKQKPGAPENDRLHRVEAHKTVLLFQDIKNDATD